MKFAKLSIILVLSFSLVSMCSVANAQAGDAQKVGLYPVTPQIEAFVAKVMQGCEPQEGKIIGAINKNGFYTLTGELFRNGRTYAVIDGEEVILCEWQKSDWKPIFVFNIQAEWTFPPGYYRQPDGRSADEQPQPFWIIELQNRPLLVIASQVEKAGQYYYVILFDAKFEQMLAFDSSFSLRPEVKHEYLITGDASRNKADFQATYFSRIKNDAFVVVKSWENSEPWHAEDREDQPDDSSNYANSDGKGYLILPDNSGSKSPADYVIFQSDPTEKRIRPYTEDKSGKPFAAIYLKPSKESFGDYGRDETLAFLFEKLTGLPRELYPDYERLNLKAIPQPQWETKVTGTDKAIIQLLSPASDVKKERFD